MTQFPSGNITAGDSIIITFAMDDVAGAVSCNDTRGNSYSVDADITNPGNVRTVVLSAHHVVGLSSGDFIRVTHPATAARVVSANEFAGLAVGARDQTQSAIGTGKAPSSGTAASTTQARELLIGAIGVAGPLTDTFKAGAQYTALGADGTTITIDSEFQIVQSIGAFDASGRLNKSRSWAASIVTYK